MKLLFKKALNYLDNKDVQDSLRNIFRDILTGTSLITLITASAIWTVRVYDVAGWSLILPHAFFWHYYFYVVLFLHSVNIREVIFLKEKKKPNLCRNLHTVISGSNYLQYFKCNHEVNNIV